jgi:hypothetical protein
MSYSFYSSSCNSAFFDKQSTYFKSMISTLTCTLALFVVEVT